MSKWCIQYEIHAIRNSSILAVKLESKNRICAVQILTHQHIWGPRFYDQFKCRAIAHIKRLQIGLFLLCPKIGK